MLVSCGHSFGGLMLRKVLETVSGAMAQTLGVLSLASWDAICET